MLHSVGDIIIFVEFYEVVYFWRYMSGRLPAFFDNTGNEGQMNTMRNVGGEILDNLKEFPYYGNICFHPDWCPPQEDE